VGFNYDCGAEAGLEAEGFQYGDITPGLRWKDHARIIADATTNAELKPDGAFKLYKAHGCAGRYREVASVNEDSAADSIVVRTSQLHNWQGADWIRDPFRDRARNHILLLVGFSGQDPKVTSELRDVLEDVYRAHPADGTPRIVAIDRDPQTTALESLVKSGLGEGEPSDGNVTQVCTDGSTATAAMLVLLAEMLAIRLQVALEEQNVALPTERDERLGTLVISAPTMVRWSFLVRRPGPEEWMQRANLMAQRGYVPLNENRAMSARVIGARQEIRRRLGRDDPESSKEALENHGFLVDAGRALALMPVGVSHEQLLATCHQGVELENMRRMLPHPKRLECILVSGDGAELRGVSLAKGKEVDLDWVD